MDISLAYQFVPCKLCGAKVEVLTKILQSNDLLLPIATLLLAKKVPA